ncbi:MAG: ABC transporter ATP-binding protein [Thermaceae bacterium]|nr:ABC transporter ATP-binding protein [Thermaceae bacterium]
MVAVEDVWKQYIRSREPALKAINLELRGGHCYGLLGPNGSGKTTLSRLLVGLLRPTRGSITINGITVDNAGKNAVPIGYVPQTIPYFPGLTGRDLIEFALVTQGYWGQTLRKAREEVVELLGIGEIEKKLIWYMSGGQARITLVATALSFKPPILVLDEPSAGLDVTNRHKLWSALEAFKKRYKPTILLVTHDIREAEPVIDQAIILRKGQVVSQGAIAELRRNHSPLLICTVIADQQPHSNDEWRQVSPGHYQTLIAENSVSSVLKELDSFIKAGAAEVSIRAASLEEIVFAEESASI